LINVFGSKEQAISIQKIYKKSKRTFFKDNNHYDLYFKKYFLTLKTFLKINPFLSK